MTLRYRWISQTQARARLKALATGLTPPRPIYDKPDGRERVVHVVRVLRSVLRRAS